MIVDYLRGRLKKYQFSNWAGEVCMRNKIQVKFIQNKHREGAIKASEYQNSQYPTMNIYPNSNNSNFFIA